MSPTTLTPGVRVTVRWNAVKDHPEMISTMTGTFARREYRHLFIVGPTGRETPIPLQHLLSVDPA